MKSLPKRMKVTTALTLLVGVAVLVVSMKEFRWTPETRFEVLRRMCEYQQDGRYDDAISLGNAWITKYPQDGSNDQVFGQIALLYLEKAKKDVHSRDEYITQAIGYRDKMLPIALDARLGRYSLTALQDAALISEY